MTHEAALHIKQRKMQPNKPKFKLNPQILLRRPERLLENFLQGIPARSPAKGFCSGTLYPRTLKSWKSATLDSWSLVTFEPWSHATLESCNPRSPERSWNGGTPNLASCNLRACYPAWKPRALRITLNLAPCGAVELTLFCGSYCSHFKYT